MHNMCMRNGACIQYIFLFLIHMDFLKFPENARKWASKHTDLHVSSQIKQI